MKKLTPKFLTPEIAQLAVRRVTQSLNQLLPEDKRGLYVVVIAPKLLVDESEDASYPTKYTTEPQVLYEEDFGAAESCKKIAQCKALQLWDGSNPGDAVTETPAHLLFPGDTRYWGGDEMEGLVVACSGLKPYFDKAVSRMILAMLIGLAAHNKKENLDTSKDFV